MFSKSCWAILGGLMLACVGCAKSLPGEQAAEKSEPAEKAMGGVGVVDLTMVAKRIRRDVEMNDAVEERRATLNKKLLTLQNSLRRLYEQKKDSFGDDPTEEQVAELKASEERMERELFEVKRKSEAELATFHQSLIDAFREQTKPILREVASERGLSIVIPKNEGLLLTIDPKVEITDEVAARMPRSGDDEPTDKPARKSKKRAAAASTETSQR
ncbi:MAG: OmpH family outer membrane protein [Planctomycetes bacterium]|nr:OmpH family outer membrane protein [Planctomycetota bacterium]